MSFSAMPNRKISTETGGHLTERVCPICNLRPVNQDADTCGGECGYELRRRRYYAEKERRKAGMDPTSQPSIPDQHSHPQFMVSKPASHPPQRLAETADEGDTDRLLLPKRTFIREVEPEPRATTVMFPERGIFCDGDNHYPISDPVVEAAKVAFLRDVKPTTWVNVGDLIDCWFISRYTKEASRLFGQYGARLQEEIDSARPYVETVCGVVSEAHYILGNHEHRQGKLISENPGLHGLRALGWKAMLEYPANLQVHPYGTRLKAGEAPLDFIHGDTIPMGVKNKPLWILANKGNRSTIFGHSHHKAEATRTFYDEHGEPIIHGAYEQGHGSIVSEQTYVSEPNWQPSFNYIEFWRDEHQKVRFSVHPILIIDGRFAWNGRVYDGRKWQ